MNRLLLRCPDCGTVFRAPASLPGHGRVRCGVCGTVFAAPPPAVPAPAAAPPPVAPPVTAPVAPTAAPSSGPARRLPSGVAGLLRGGAVVVLLLLAAGQLLWLARNRAAELPALRPLLEAACGRLGCRLPPYRDLQALRVAEVQVTAHPDYAGALLAVLRLENPSPLPQPWPRLALALTGPGGTVVAERLFEPAEYLPAEQQAAAQFAAGAVVEVRLPLADPGTAATGARCTLY